MPSKFPKLAGFIQRHQLEGFAEVVLEATRPLTTMNQQMLYFAQPLAGLVIPDDSYRELVALFETRDSPRELLKELASLNEKEPLHE